ncbi:MAG TPA: response regulator [Actinomycetota bacterium]|jgi:CheY-like chemotaxis protein|nr:response regulator [Actinomycetota bacterium]
MTMAQMEGVKGRVLVAEDDLHLREAICELLKRMGFSVVGAADGGEAVAIARDQEPDVVLMDIRMPIMDGIEASRRIRASQPLVQVVVLSAYDDPGLHQDAEAAGAYCFLVKGCPPNMIDEMITRACEYKRQLEHNRDASR